MCIENRLSILAFLAMLLTQSVAIADAASLLCAEKLAEAAVPQDAFYLPESMAMELNNALNDHNMVRLDPNGDYARAFSITLKSNQALYGLAATKVPKITISAGAKNVIVSDIQSEEIAFPSSNLVTSDNCFNRIRTSLEIKNTKLENNLFTDFQGGIINIDNSKSGYIRNNRFIKTMTHTAWPALTIVGNTKEPSYGNHFVWTNILGPLGDSVVIDQQQDIAFTGIDIESWSRGNTNGLEVSIHHPAAINVYNTDFLSIFMSHGGNLRVEKAQYFNLDAKNILLQGSFVKAQTIPGLVLGKHVEHLLAINTCSIGHKVESENTQVIELFKNDKPNLIRNWQVLENSQLPSGLLPATTNMLEHERNIYTTWKKPILNRISDPMQQHGRQDMKVHNDASESIQKLVNQKNIAQLEAGIYYLSKSIELKDGQGIVGAGQNKTILVAKNSNIDLIVGANRVNVVGGKSTWFVLADLTLQDARNGIYHGVAGSGGGAQYHRSILSHITFRNMANAAIMLDSIYAWDNNFLDNINFINCAAAIKQRPNPAYKGGDVPGTTYMDKNVCYRCQFENNAIALDMPGKRGNGLNAFIDSQFKNNGKVMSAIYPLSNFFANSIFINNHGNPSFETNKSLGFVHSDFIQTVPGSIFQGNTLCNGCRFDVRNPNASVITSAKNQKAELIFFINSNLAPSVAKSIDSGLILGSSGSNPADMHNLLIHDNRTVNIFKLDQEIQPIDP